MLNMDNSKIVSTNISNAPLIYMHKGDSEKFCIKFCVESTIKIEAHAMY